MRAAIISYHKNVDTIYPKEWIDRYKRSIDNQTTKDIPVYELNYGGGLQRIFENSYFESTQMPTFVHGMNYLLDKLFSSGYDFVFNTNCDDWYAPDWIQTELLFAKAGYDLVSCNFHLVENERVTHSHNFSTLNIEKHLQNNHNIIAHPAVCYSKNFWKRNRYAPEEIPLEDLKLWQRAIKNSTFAITPEHLLFHRIHKNSVCKSENR